MQGPCQLRCCTCSNKDRRVGSRPSNHIHLLLHELNHFVVCTAWHRVACVRMQELEKKGELEDGDPLNNFFKKIFSQGDDDQRRAMMKSFVESNGTVLSTNWQDVGAKKVECTPPDGMEVKTWKD